MRTCTVRASMVSFVFAVSACFCAATECKEVQIINYLSIPYNYETTVSLPASSRNNTHSCVLNPWQAEMYEVVYTDGSTDPWNPSGFRSETVEVVFESVSLPASQQAVLPEYDGMREDTWSQVEVTCTVHVNWSGGGEKPPPQEPDTRNAERLDTAIGGQFEIRN